MMAVPGPTAQMIRAEVLPWGVHGQRRRRTVKWRGWLEGPHRGPHGETVRSCYKGCAGTVGIYGIVRWEDMNLDEWPCGGSSSTKHWVGNGATRSAESMRDRLWLADGKRHWVEAQMETGRSPFPRQWKHRLRHHSRRRLHPRGVMWVQAAEHVEPGD